jgi:hypothetical protein
MFTRRSMVGYRVYPALTGKKVLIFINKQNKSW